MSRVHIIGFGEEVQVPIKTRKIWHPEFPSSGLKLDKGDSIIVNVKTLFEVSYIQQLSEMVSQLLDKGGVLIAMTAPYRTLTAELGNYSFLPWSRKILDTIRVKTLTSFRVDTKAPEWLKRYYRQFKAHLVSSVSFDLLPSGSHRLAKARLGRRYNYETAAVLFHYKRGHIILLPPPKSLLFGTIEPSALSELLAALIDIVKQFGELTDSTPAWLESIRIQEEEALLHQLHKQEQRLKEIQELKGILHDSGAQLTHKVTSIFTSIGFHATETEIEGHEDITLTDGEFQAVVECGGTKGFFSVRKLRQLFQWVMEQGVGTVKGIFVGNPFRDIHPKNRDVQKAFSSEAIQAAERLEICLVTVPHLLRVFLDTDPKDYGKIRASLQKCAGLWQYPVKPWT